MSKLFLIALTCLSLGGCATLFNGDPQNINAEASRGEKNVEVRVTSTSGSYTDTLPTQISAISSNNGVTVSVIDSKYKHSITVVHKSVTPSYIANILFWPGFIIDWATGKMWKYDQSVFVNTQEKRG